MSVSITIKSEIDSRVLLYQLMRCLLPLGNVLIVTSNKYVSRLIDGDFEGHFRNFYILVDLDGGTDELIEEVGVDLNDYTYIIYDNVGVLNQTKLLIPIGPIVSDVFEEEMLLLGEDRDTHLVRFGTPIKINRGKLLKKPDKDSVVGNTDDVIDGSSNSSITLKDTGKAKLTDDEVNDLARSKFKPVGEDILTKLKKMPNLTFPKFDDIELLESNKVFYPLDNNFRKFFFTVFQEFIGISEPNFMKEVGRRDESSNSFR